MIDRRDCPHRQSSEEHFPDSAKTEAIRIDDVEKLRETVEWARKNGAPLVPVSSTAPHFHATLGTCKDARMLDLSRMKRVKKINRRNWVALFEAGATFHELVPQLADAGLRCTRTAIPQRFIFTGELSLKCQTSPKTADPTSCD